jgi:hypothetical protein
MFTGRLGQRRVLKQFERDGAAGGIFESPSLPGAARARSPKPLVQCAGVVSWGAPTTVTAVSACFGWPD